MPMKQTSARREAVSGRRIVITGLVPSTTDGLLMMVPRLISQFVGYVPTAALPALKLVSNAPCAGFDLTDIDSSFAPVAMSSPWTAIACTALIVEPATMPAVEYDVIFAS